MATTALMLPSGNPLSPLAVRGRVPSPLTMAQRMVTVIYLAALPMAVLDFILASLSGDSLVTLSGEELRYV